MSNSSSNLVELFSSIQGEGLFVGLRQIFLRFHGCLLNCDYCDSQGTRTDEAPSQCRVEEKPGKGKFLLLENPISCGQVESIITEWRAYCPHAHHSISITGGEPLLHVETLTRWLPVLRNYLPIYLETNGIYGDELSECIEYIDFISMDVKLPSTTGINDLWEKHRFFLKIASERDVFIKVVINDLTQDWEIRRTCEIISSLDASIPLVLQPQTSLDGKVCISPSNLYSLQEIASTLIKNIRVIPQTHRFLGLL
jgi:organic radical activating enzyme